MSPHFAQRMEKVEPSAIKELLALGADPAIISFGGGYPDASLFPVAQLEQVFRDVIRAPGGAAMQYAPSDGLPRLREQIAALMVADGTPCGTEDVLILQGSQHHHRRPYVSGGAHRLQPQPAPLCRRAHGQ